LSFSTKIRDMSTQEEKGKAFRELHERPAAFIIPNPWDAGSAVLLARLGFEALATTSAGCAFSLGRRDNAIGRDEAIRHLSTIASATELPVSGDLENGFGDDPGAAAETIRQAGASGAVGASIEDATYRAEAPIYDLGLAVERIRAAVEVARSFSFPFTLTARCENYLVGRSEIGETIKRLQAYQDAGADVLYAPGVARKDEIATLVKSLDRPVNVIAALQGFPTSLSELSELGVRRISVGSALARAAYGAFLRAAEEMKNSGTFDFSDQAVSYRDLNVMFPV
jgi:2-methylisocitrate lyase-like PEP mutase family enzyme